MEPSPGLALACVVVIWDLGVRQEREIHRTQKSEAALGEARAFLETQELLLFIKLSNSWSKVYSMGGLCSFWFVWEWFSYSYSDFEWFWRIFVDSGD